MSRGPTMEQHHRYQSGRLKPRASIGGRWLRELAEACAYAAEAATTGGGPKDVARLEELIREAAEPRKLHPHDVARAVAREWYLRGVTASADLLAAAVE